MAAKKKTKKKASAAPRKKKVAAKKAAPKKKVAPPKKKKVAAKEVVAKAAPKKKVKAKAKPRPSVGGDKRRDATGHLRPEYAKQLREKSREFRDDGNDNQAFFKKSRAHDDLAEELGEEAVQAMTSGEDASDRLEAPTDEEVGGPFIRTRGRQEFARGTDKSNPKDATREPFPKV